MKSNLEMNFSVDKESKKIRVKKELAAPVSKVWTAWTQSEILDQWWAPKPWQAKTKVMDFKVGGYWLYAMVGPDGTTHWCRADYKSIAPLKAFSAQDGFCDESGKIDDSFPRSLWRIDFSEAAEVTLVSVEIAYDELSDLEKIIEMGFKEGFTAGLENLDEVLK